jgi:parvulin-like peptidyl-prolyl isomerase
MAALVAAGCSGVGGGIPENAICTVDGEPILKKDYEKILSQAKANYTQQGQKFPKKGTDAYKQLSNSGVDYLIEQELLKREAEELGVKVKAKDIDKRLKQLKESFFQGDAKRYKAELKKQGLTEADVKANIEQQLLTEKLFEKVTKNVKVSDKKAKAYFEDNPTQYKQPESRDVAHILVKTKKEADAVYAQVKGGDKKVFAKVAKAKSQDPSSAQRGGELTITRGQTVPAFDKTSFAIKVNEISKPVKTEFGYHIITARGEVKEARTQDFKEVSKQIKQTLEQENRSKRMQDWREDLRKDAEDTVECKKGFVWTQTVKSTDSTETGAPATEDEAAEDDKKSDDKADDKKADDKKADADEKADDAKADDKAKTDDAKEPADN